MNKIAHVAHPAADGVGRVRLVAHPGTVLVRVKGEVRLIEEKGFPVRNLLALRLGIMVPIGIVLTAALLNADDLAQFALLQKFPHRQRAGAAPSLGAILHNLCGLHHHIICLVQFIQIHRNGLFHIGILPRLYRIHQLSAVLMIRRGDDHRVDVRILQQFQIVCILFRFSAKALAHLFCAPLPLRIPDITHRDDLRRDHLRGTMHPADMPASPSPAADRSQQNFLIRPIHPPVRPRCQRGSQRDTPGFNKFPSRCISLLHDGFSFC